MQGRRDGCCVALVRAVTCQALVSFYFQPNKTRREPRGKHGGRRSIKVKSTREAARRGVGRRERMKRGSGIKVRDEARPSQSFPTKIPYGVEGNADTHCRRFSQNQAFTLIVVLAISSSSMSYPFYFTSSSCCIHAISIFSFFVFLLVFGVRQYSSS